MIDDLKLELKPYPDDYRWRVRRVFIGLYLGFAYLFTMAFIVFASIDDTVATSSERVADERGASEGQKPPSTPEASVVPTEIGEARGPDEADEGAMPTRSPVQNGVGAAPPMTSSESNAASASVAGAERASSAGSSSRSESIGDLDQWFESVFVTTVVFGILGALFMATRTFVRTTNFVDVPVAWYVTLPVQGALMAIFLFVLLRAGQITFFGADGGASDRSINSFTVSLLALIGGMFTDTAFERLRKVGRGALGDRKEEDTGPQPAEQGGGVA